MSDDTVTSWRTKAVKVYAWMQAHRFASGIICGTLTGLVLAWVF